MSHWTHIRGIIEIDTLARTTPESRFLAETAINHLPRITGSEGPAKLYITIPDGYNMSSSCDENNKRTNLGSNDGYNLFHIQTRALITICGDLRDRLMPQTIRETNRLLNRLAKMLLIESCVITIQDGIKQHIIANPPYLFQIETGNWRTKILNYNLDDNPD